MKRILSELISYSMLDTTAPYILHRALKAVTSQRYHGLSTISDGCDS